MENAERLSRSQDQTKRPFVSIPFFLLKEKYLSYVIHHRVNVEIALRGDDLDRFNFKDFLKVSETLKEEGLLTTVHLPFMDLSPAAFDSMIKKASLKRLYHSMEISALFSPQNLVLHSGFRPVYYREVKEIWQKNFLEVLSELISFAEDLNLTLSLENVFEEAPDFIKPFFESYKGKLFWCFDPAHARVFSKEHEKVWLKELYFYLKEIHVHDNSGKEDEHLAVGKGNIDFDFIFTFLKEKELRPLLVSEAHTEEDTLLNINYLSSMLSSF